MIGVATVVNLDPAVICEKVTSGFPLNCQCLAGSRLHESAAKDSALSSGE